MAAAVNEDALADLKAKLESEENRVSQLEAELAEHEGQVALLKEEFATETAELRRELQEANRLAADAKMIQQQLEVAERELLSAKKELEGANVAKKNAETELKKEREERGEEKRGSQQRVSALERELSQENALTQELHAKIAMLQEILGAAGESGQLPGGQDLIEGVGLANFLESYAEKKELRNVYVRLYKDARDRIGRLMILQKRYRDVNIKQLTKIVKGLRSRTGSSSSLGSGDEDAVGRQMDWDGSRPPSRAVAPSHGLGRIPGGSTDHFILPPSPDHRLRSGGGAGAALAPPSGTGGGVTADPPGATAATGAGATLHTTGSTDFSTSRMSLSRDQRMENERDSPRGHAPLSWRGRPGTTAGGFATGTTRYKGGRSSQKFYEVRKRATDPGLLVMSSPVLIQESLEIRASRSTEYVRGTYL